MAKSYSFMNFAKVNGMMFDVITCTNHTTQDKFKSLRFRKSADDKQGVLVGFPKNWVGPTEQDTIISERKKLDVLEGSNGKWYLVHANQPIDLNALED